MQESSRVISTRSIYRRLERGMGETRSVSFRCESYRTTELPRVTRFYINFWQSLPSTDPTPGLYARLDTVPAMGPTSVSRHASPRTLGIFRALCSKLLSTFGMRNDARCDFSFYFFFVISLFRTYLVFNLLIIAYI